MAIAIPYGSDLTGYTVRSQLRASVESDVVLHEWSTVDESVTVEPGMLLLHCPAEVTSAWKFNLAVMDVEVVSPTNQTTRVASLRVRLSREVTR